MIRELAGLPRRHPRVGSLFWAVLAFSTALTLVTAAIASVVGTIVLRGPIGRPDLVAPALVNLAAYLVLTNVGWNLDGIFASFVAGKQLFWIRLHEAVAYVIIAVLASTVEAGVWGLVIATAGASATALVHRVVSARAFLPARVSRSELRSGFATLPEMIRFGLKIAPGTIAQGVSSQIATWTLGIIRSASTWAPTTGHRPSPPASHSSISGSRRSCSDPRRPARSRRRGWLDRALVDTMRYTTAGMLLLAAVVGGAARGVMDLFGGGFTRAAATALSLLILAPALLNLSLMLAHALYAVDRPWATTVIAWGRTLITGVATIVPCLATWDQRCRPRVGRGHRRRRNVEVWDRPAVPRITAPRPMDSAPSLRPHRRLRRRFQCRPNRRARGRRMAVPGARRRRRRHDLHRDLSRPRRSSAT